MSLLSQVRAMPSRPIVPQCEGQPECGHIQAIPGKGRFCEVLKDPNYVFTTIVACPHDTRMREVVAEPIKPVNPLKASKRAAKGVR